MSDAINESMVPAALAAKVGQRVLTRTYYSGVSIGILQDVVVGGGMITLTLTDAVRIWQWEGAFTVSELARVGGTCRVARHPDGVSIVEQGAEVVPVSDEAWLVIQKQWSEGAR